MVSAYYFGCSTEPFKVQVYMYLRPRPFPVRAPAILACPQYKGNATNNHAWRPPASVANPQHLPIPTSYLPTEKKRATAQKKKSRQHTILNVGEKNDDDATATNRMILNQTITHHQLIIIITYIYSWQIRRRSEILPTNYSVPTRAPHRRTPPTFVAFLLRTAAASARSVDCYAKNSVIGRSKLPAGEIVPL